MNPRLQVLCAGSERGTGGGLMVGYHKSAPTGTPPGASVGVRCKSPLQRPKQLHPKHPKHPPYVDDSRAKASQPP